MSRGWGTSHSGAQHAARPGRSSRTSLAVALAAGLVFAGAVTALAGVGQPTPGEVTLQDPVTEVARGIVSLYDMVTYIIIGIAAFVLVLLGYVIVRFNAGANPTPSMTTHNTLLEVVWTVLPIAILVVIAVPSFRLLFLEYAYPPPDITIKAVGNTWFWEYEYPDQAGLKVSSNMINDEDLLKASLEKDEFSKRYKSLDGIELIRRQYADAKPLWDKSPTPRMLTVDHEIAVPLNKVVHVLITSNDVIHSWTIPSFGVKQQAVPGRVEATWFKATQTGVFYGQCSVVCGRNHSNMPIAIRVVPQAAFDDWVAAAKAKDWKKARGILITATEPAPGAPKFADAAQ